jgi:hypothetical protein
MEGFIIISLVLLFDPFMHLVVWASDRRWRRKRKEEFKAKGWPL